ncbi:hypothetical protein PV341_38060 [Streptomyces sp. PA03-1a]|nr:hypothetical protein [Streptomyces sp. PA03-1a]MDX2813376.1 hypothetical protein [Streptomyces sp. PA03-5A]
MSTERPTEDTTPVQPRIPGVRYRKAERYRLETTVIDGVPETRKVLYTTWEPVPPRDWDDIIVRGVTAVAVGVTVLALAGTTAAIGGLLHRVVPVAISYGTALVFDLSWLASIAIEHVERLYPPRARAARNTGWVALLISMGSIVAFGGVMEQWAAGCVAAAVPLLSKGLWWLVLRTYAVPLSDGVAFWMHRRREKAVATLAVAGQLRRIDRHRRYAEAVYGPQASTAAEILSAPAQALPVVEVPGHVADTSGRPDPDPSGQPAPTAPEPARTVSGHDEDTGPDTAEEPPAPVPPVAPVGGSIAATIRAELAKDKSISDEDLIERVRAVHPDRDDSKLAGTVVRTRHRQENPPKKSRRGA